MLNSLKVKNFTAFAEANLEFSPGLNVIIGENNTGKSHLLKLAYTVASVWHEAATKQEESLGKISSGVSKRWWQRRLAEKLVGVFKPEKLGRLCRRSGQTVSKTELTGEIITATKTTSTLQFDFATASKKEVTLTTRPNGYLPTLPIYFPAKEALSLYPGFINAYEKFNFPLEEVYYDLCKALSGFSLRNQRNLARFLKPLEQMLGGQVKFKADHFYIHFPAQGDLEISLVAEGLRKIAMLTYLLANDSLKPGTLFFWDEPELHLNAKILTPLARLLVEFTEKRQLQIILTTHSFFLMKELSVLVEVSKGKIPARFFGLASSQAGTQVEGGDLLEDLPTIIALDEILAQDDRVQQLFYEGKI